VSNLDLASFETLLPSFENLVEFYGIDPSVAFFLWRPILAQNIKQYDADQAIQIQKQKLLKGLAASEKLGNLQENEKSSASTPRDNLEAISVATGNEISDPEESQETIAPRSQGET
jgi:hypothetical protein